MSKMESLVLPRKRENITQHSMGKDVVLHDEVNGKVHVLNRTAAYIWANCDGTGVIDKLVDDILNSEEGVEREEVREDIHIIVQEFLSKGLVLSADT